ncbi:MAG: DUF3426 domain-containing protein [Lysobacterales bacterium]
MTAPECPVCATPHEAGAEHCAFCGVSLREPPPQVEADAEIEPEAEAEAETSTPAEEPSSPTAAAIVAPVDIAGIAETTAIPAHDPAPEAPETTEAADLAAAPEPETEPETEPEAGEDADTPETPETPEIPAPAASRAPRTRTPSFARKPSTASTAQQRARRIEWSVVAGLAALLVLQSVAADFGQLAGNAATRPWLQRACAFLRCTLPPWREPQALRLLQRDVSANPDRPGVLRISASFRNDARWAQPWPRLRVTLSDADGRAIAARDFVANEYLGAMPTANGIASGQVAGVAVDVVDPSPRVTAFTFEFR